MFRIVYVSRVINVDDLGLFIFFIFVMYRNRVGGLKRNRTGLSKIRGPMYEQTFRQNL